MHNSSPHLRDWVLPHLVLSLFTFKHRISLAKSLIVTYKLFSDVSLIKGHRV